MVYVSTIISGVASLGVFVALVSAIFFLVLTGLKWVSRLRATLYEEELERQKRLFLGNPYLTSNGSSTFTEGRKDENGLGNTLRNKPVPEKNKRIFSNGEGTADEDELRSPEKPLENPGTVSADTARVREFIEKLVEKMAGGPLDGTTVGRLSSDPAYLAMFGKYHGLLCQELAGLGYALHLSLAHEKQFDFGSTNSSHSSLEHLIKRLTSEAAALPRLRDSPAIPEVDRRNADDDFDNKSYEDILATAILNKIIENCQRKNENKNEIIDERKKKNRRKAGKLRRNADDQRTSDSEWSDSSRSDRLSLTIEEYIEEVTTAYEISDDEKCETVGYDVTASQRVPFPEYGKTVRDAGTDDESSDLEEGPSSATELVTSPSSWEENWLFQKKKLRSTPNVHHPVPVPMLVPNPSEDFRALVGGVDADDLSDMSDCSDSVLESLIDQEEKTASHYDEKLQEQATSIVKEPEREDEKIADKQLVQTEELILNENKNVAEIKEDCISVGENIEVSSSSLISSEVLSQKDREFSVENVDLVHQYEPGSSNPPISGSYLALDAKEIEENEKNVENEEFKKKEGNEVRCRIAEREKNKWENPVPLAENPYSVENIEKREKRNEVAYFRLEPCTRDFIDFPDDASLDDFSTCESERLRFKRDYYVNASKYPSGTFSSSSLSFLSQGKEKVSKHSYDDFSFSNDRPSDKRCKSKNAFDKMSYSVYARHLSVDENLKNSFLMVKKQAARNQHFFKVFQTPKLTKLEADKATKGNPRYGFHSLKLRPRTKMSLEQKLSDFEQQSLREDVKHSLLRARGASPNFIINPVFEQDKETRSRSRSQAPKDRSDEPATTDSEAECELRDLQPFYRQTSRAEGIKRIAKGGRKSQESGYGSDSLDYSSDSLEYWRLTPPKTPEVVESSLVFASKSTKSKESLQRKNSSFLAFY